MMGWRSAGAVFESQGRVPAYGTLIGARHARPRVARLVDVASSLGEGTLAVEGATLAGDQIAALVLRHTAARAQRAFGLGIGKVGEHGCTPVS
jgi:hypothetical protein